MDDSISGAERIQAAIGLEQLDRVPVAPLVMYFAAGFRGISTKEFLNDPQGQAAAKEFVFERMGGWDAWYSASGPTTAGQLKARSVIQYKFPGDGLPDDAPLPQLNEQPFMSPEDYDLIPAVGYSNWYNEYRTRLYPSLDAAALLTTELARTDSVNRRFYQKWHVERQVPILAGVVINHPIDTLSFARTFSQFCLDILRRPDKVLAAAEVICSAHIEGAVNRCKEIGISGVWIGGFRTGASFMSPKQYHKFVAPFIDRMVRDLLNKGLTPLLHFDADWTAFLPFLRDLPAGKCILAVDQATDLFKAKKVLGDRICLMGNVAPDTMVLGTVDETVQECRRLIDVVGAGGGFILSSGCEVPYNTKPKNLAALIETAKTYKPRRT